MKLYITSLSILILAACNSTKRVVEKPIVLQPVKTEEKEKIEKVKGGIDTIYWTEIDRTKDYNQKIEDIDLEKKDVYNVSLLIPFELDKSKYSDLEFSESKLSRMTHFYAGVKLALRQLADEGIQLNTDVYDTESGNFDKKLRECRDADVIIGPHSREQLEVAANFGRANEIPVISPWLSSTSLAKENPYYIQIIPSVRDHYARIVEHVTSNFQNDQIILLGKDDKKDRSMFHYIQNLAAAVNGGDDPQFQEFFVNLDSLREGIEAFDKIFFKDKPTVFILPHYSYSEDEDFVYNCVRKLSGEKGLDEVIVYGMPLMIESDKIKFEHYINLNMRICRSNYVDKNDPVIQEFRKLYFEEYFDFPSEEAYKAYDLMLFIGRNMFDYGKQFHRFFDRYEASMMQTKFDIQKVYKEGEQEISGLIDYQQNKHLYILAFENYRFNKL